MQKKQNKQWTVKSCFTATAGQDKKDREVKQKWSELYAGLRRNQLMGNIQSHSHKCTGLYDSAQANTAYCCSPLYQTNLCTVHGQTFNAFTLLRPCWVHVCHSYSISGFCMLLFMCLLCWRISAPCRVPCCPVFLSFLREQRFFSV